MHNLPPPLSAADHLARLEATPLRLTGGRPLQDWLTHETNLGAARAEAALNEYRRFLALALAAPDQPRMPGPVIAQIWQLHREDSAAWSAFWHAIGQGAPEQRPSRWEVPRAPAYPATRAAYGQAFGPPPRAFWPAPRLLAFRQTADRLFWPLLWLWTIIWSGLPPAVVPEWPLGPFLFWSPVLAHLWLARRIPTRFRRYGPPRGLLSIPAENRSLTGD